MAAVLLNPSISFSPPPTLPFLLNMEVNPSPPPPLLTPTTTTTTTPPLVPSAVAQDKLSELGCWYSALLQQPHSLDTESRWGGGACVCVCMCVHFCLLRNGIKARRCPPGCLFKCKDPYLVEFVCMSHCDRDFCVWPTSIGPPFVYKPISAGMKS